MSSSCQTPDFASMTEHIIYDSEQKMTRCSSCGNLGIFTALKKALTAQWLKPHEVVIAFDVWCSGNGSDKIMANTIHGLHGRVIPLASGIHLGNTQMPVLAMAGDGATLSEWINHLIHGIRNNFNITFLLHNNRNYGLTTWQASSTTPKWQIMNGTVDQVVVNELEPIQLICASKPSFVARGFSGDQDQLADLIMQGMQHRGFSVIEILQLCPTYNKSTPEQRYRQRIYDVSTDPTHDIHNLDHCRHALTLTDRIATGVLYHQPTESDYYNLLDYRKSYTTPLNQEVRHYDITDLLQSLV